MGEGHKEKDKRQKTKGKRQKEKENPLRTEQHGIENRCAIVPLSL
jgi:hypothetical protein